MAFDWLISGAASLLGGLFSSSSEKKRDKENARRVQESNDRNEKRVTTMNADVRARADKAAAVPIVTNQQTVSSVNVEAMMAGAEEAGFNPVTWLRNGGMQAYTQTSSSQQVHNSQLMDAALAGSTIFQESSPALSTARGPGEVIGQALVTGASAWVQEASQERQNQFQMAMLQAQLDGQNRSGSYSGPRSGYVPTAYLGGTHVTSKNSAILGSDGLPLSQNPGDLYWEVIDNSATGKGRRTWMPNPNLADSEQLALSALLTAQRAADDEVRRLKKLMEPDPPPHQRHPPNPKVHTGDLNRLPFGASY